MKFELKKIINKKKGWTDEINIDQIQHVHNNKIV